MIDFLNINLYICFILIHHSPSPILQILGAIISIICCNMLLIQVLPLLILGIDVGAIIFCLGLYGCVSVTVASIEQLYTVCKLESRCILQLLSSPFSSTVQLFNYHNYDVDVSLYWNCGVFRILTRCPNLTPIFNRFRVITNHWPKCRFDCSNPGVCE